MMSKYKLTARCGRAKAGAGVLVMMIFSVTFSACTPNDDARVVIPTEMKDVPLSLKLTSGPHSYRFLLSTVTLNTVVDQAMAKRDLKPLTPAECAVRECPDIVNGESETPFKYYWLPQLQAGQWTIPSDFALAPFDYAEHAEEPGGRVDGVLGVTTIGTLNWLWNRSAGTMSGYRADSRFFAAERSKMVCTAMEMLGGRAPAIQLELGGQPQWFEIDTAMTGKLSGNLNRKHLAALRAGNGIAAEVMFTPKGRPAESGRHALVQPKSISLAGVPLDGLAFDEIVAYGDSTLGVSFLQKLDNAAFDFGDHRFCIPASTRVKPDTLPTQAELERLATPTPHD
jgi:hypothetical protein